MMLFIIGGDLPSASHVLRVDRLLIYTRGRASFLTG
jgi:hypothetical protein